MGKGISKQNWMWGIFGVAACSMLSFSSSAYAGTAFSNATEVQQPLRGSISVKGVVKDQNGEPIIGASVKLVGLRICSSPFNTKHFMRGFDYGIMGSE